MIFIERVLLEIFKEVETVAYKLQNDTAIFDSLKTFCRDTKWYSE